MYYHAYLQVGSLEAMTLQIFIFYIYLYFYYYLAPSSFNVAARNTVFESLLNVKMWISK